MDPSAPRAGAAAAVIPIRTDTRTHSRQPVVWGLVLLNTAVFLWQASLSMRGGFVVAVTWGLVPRRYTDPAWAYGVGLDPQNAWPLLTNVFLHGGWLHLGLNMWTLWLFGRAVEERMGHLRFALFYVLCGVLASWAHMAAYADSMVPTVGASGAIAAVMGAHLTLFPKARVLLLIPIIIIPLILPVPTLFYFGGWFALQLLRGTGDLMIADVGAGGIAWWAHIGGFVAGLVAVRFLAPIDPRDIWRRPES